MDFMLSPLGLKTRTFCFARGGTQAYTSGEVHTLLGIRLFHSKPFPPESSRSTKSASMTDRDRSHRSSRSAHTEGRVAQVPDLSDSLRRAVSGYRPHRYPRSTGIFALWLFGLFAVFLSPAPVKITQEKLDRYTQLVTQVEATPVHSGWFTSFVVYQYCPALQAQGDPKVRAMTEQRLWEATMFTEEAKVAVHSLTLSELGMICPSRTSHLWSLVAA